jgi:hypothetical protein
MPPKKKKNAGHRWFTPVILAAQETEIRKISSGSKPTWANSLQDPISKKAFTRCRPQYCKKKKKKKKPKNQSRRPT